MVLVKCDYCIIHKKGYNKAITNFILIRGFSPLFKLNKVQ